MSFSIVSDYKVDQLAQGISGSVGHQIFQWALVVVVSTAAIVTGVWRLKVGREQARLHREYKRKKADGR